MRALTISAHGGVEKLEYRTDLPVPEPPPGHVRVRIAAAALNHLDLFALGGLPGVTTKPPWIMGADGTGIVDAIGASDAIFRDAPPALGARVVINPGISDRTCNYCLAGEQSLCVRFGLLGEHHPGTLADYIVVPSDNVRQIPDDVPFTQAAGFTLATLTAWRMIVTRANVIAGDNVLIWGIGGGVAQAAMQIAKNRGATVWVTSGNDAKLDRARELGADETLNHRTTDIAKEIRARTGKRGVNVVIDSVGQATWSQSLGALGKAGRLVTCGGTSGAIVETDVRRLFWNQWSIMGSTMGNDSEFDAIVSELREGRLLPIIDSVFDLEHGRDAFQRMQSGEQFGKIVVRVSP
ncbi:MAG: zinc-binding dehydrogenase [Gemmatimonadaceae bacterium]